MAKEDKIKDFLGIASKRLKMAIESDNENRCAAIDDLKFANGDQWDAQEKKRRAEKGRPALQINLLPKFIDQVVGDMMHNTPSVKITPEDSRADAQIAKIRQGIISNIEYQSNAKGIYGYAARQMVTCGYGGWRILTRYCDENPFMQEIFIEGIRNPFLIYLDPSSKDQNYADARWGFLLEKIPHDEFKDRFPDVEIPTSTLDIWGSTGTDQEMWFTDETVTVAEYFCKSKRKQTVHQLDDGTVITDEDYQKMKTQYEDLVTKALDSVLQPTQKPVPQQSQPGMQQPGMQQPGMQQPGMQQPGMQQPGMQLPPNIPTIASTKETEVDIIRQWIITGNEIIDGELEGNIFPGKHIPLILLKGKELNIEGKNYVYSLIRHAKDPQKLVNYWNTSAAETIALAPKSPWLGTPRQFEGFEEDYASANVENFAFLKYNPDPEAPGPPQRTSPGQPPTAIFEQIRRGEENIKSVIGMFNADIGASGSEQTGAAIRARQRPGDISTYEFTENWSRAILYTGKIINDMIPEVYDTERDVRIKNDDGSDTFVPTNTTVGSAIKQITQNPHRFRGLNPKQLRSTMIKDGSEARFNDITCGKYGVVVKVGPSYATQREESAAMLMQLVQAMPQQMAVAADLIVENMDFKSADELSKRLRKPLVASGVIEPRPDEQPPQPQGPSPEVQVQQALVQVEAAKTEVEKVRVENEKVKIELEKLKTERDIAEANVKLRMNESKNQTQEAAAIRKYELDTAKLRQEMIKIMKELNSPKTNVN